MPDKLTPAMRTVLENLAAGRWEFEGTHSKRQRQSIRLHGTHKLVAAGLAIRDEYGAPKITDVGRAALETVRLLPHQVVGGAARRGA